MVAWRRSAVSSSVASRRILGRDQDAQRHRRACDLACPSRKGQQPRQEKIGVTPPGGGRSPALPPDCRSAIPMKFDDEIVQGFSDAR